MNYRQDRKKWLRIIVLRGDIINSNWTENWRASFGHGRIQEIRRAADKTNSSSGVRFYSAGIALVTPLVARLLNTPYIAEVEPWALSKKSKRKKTPKKP